MKAMLIALALAPALLSGPAPACAQELRLYAWSEYVPQSVIDAFTDETGIVVDYTTYASNEEMMGHLAGGQEAYDLVQPSDYMVETMIRLGGVQKLDHKKIPNLVHLDRAYRNLPFDSGNLYSVPWMAGTVGIVVNTDVVKTPIGGLADLFRPEHAGRIVALDDARELLAAVLAYQGKDANTINSTVLSEARPILQEWMKMIAVFDSDSPKTAILDGTADLGLVWSGEAALLYEQDPKYAFVLPREGAHRFIDTLAIPANARNVDAAHAFINFILRPEISKLISDDFPYVNPNAEARKLLTREQRSNPASNPPRDAKTYFFRDVGRLATDVQQMFGSLKPPATPDSAVAPKAPARPKADAVSGSPATESTGAPTPTGLADIPAATDGVQPKRVPAPTN